MLPLLLVLFAQAPATTVKLSVSGLPAESPLPEIQITLPNGQSTKISDPSEFVSKLPGKYRVSGQAFRVAGELIDTVLEAAVREQTVPAGATVTLQLNYGPRPGSGMLWAATDRINEDTDDFTKGTIRGITEAALLAGNFSAPTRQILSGPRLFGGFAAPDGAFYYVDSWDVQMLMRVYPAALGSGGGKPAGIPKTAVMSYSLSPSGDLWSFDHTTLRRLSTNSLTPGAPIDELRIEEEEDGLPTVHFLFTKSGDLLLYGGSKAARIPAEKLKGKRTLRIADAAAMTTYPGGNKGHGALDEAGNLWLPDENSQVVKIPAAALENGGAIEPDAFEVPQSASALMVDNSSGVWVLIRWTGELYYLPAGASAFTLKGSFGKGFSEATKLTLNPPPPWSPLAQAPGFPRRLTTEESR